MLIDWTGRFQGPKTVGFRVISLVIPSFVRKAVAYCTTLWVLYCTP